MRIDRAAAPFVALAAVPSAVCGLLGWLAVALVLLVLPVAVTLFFRDPDRTPPRDPGLVLAPADGRVMYTGPADRTDLPVTDNEVAREWQQVTIFLSLFDVHINRTPVSGTVRSIRYQPGAFLPAYKPEASRNERSEIWIDHDGVPIVARQVVGLLARRVVCRLTTGQSVAAGQRLGLMKFGSRMDVFVPASASLEVTPGQSVRAAETVLARLVVSVGE